MITLCVPTRNRPLFLRRLLRYYAATHSPHWLLVGDASDPPQALENQEVAASYAPHLQVRYESCRGMSSCATLERLSQVVTTPYCAYLADDDFLCVRGIDRCVAFLEAHPDYGAAHGTALLFQTEKGTPCGPIGNLRRYPQAVLGSETGAARLQEFFGRSLYTLLYSVHRTPTWRAMFAGVGALPGAMNQNIFKDELIPVCVSVIRGKVKEVEGLYLVRHAHDGIYKHPAIYDWLTDPSWFPSYQIFHDRVVEELVRQDGISAAEAQTILKQAFWPYLAQVLTRGWIRQQAGARARPRSRLQTVARRIPGARPVWRLVRRFVRGSGDLVSPQALLRSGSPHAADWAPIYQAVTGSDPDGSHEPQDLHGVSARVPVEALSRR